jgi:hypothetical protein
VPRSHARFSGPHKAYLRARFTQQLLTWPRATSSHSTFIDAPTHTSVPLPRRSVTPAGVSDAGKTFFMESIVQLSTSAIRAKGARGLNQFTGCSERDGGDGQLEDPLKRRKHEGNDVVRVRVRVTGGVGVSTLVSRMAPVIAACPCRATHRPSAAVLGTVLRAFSEARRPSAVWRTRPSPPRRQGQSILRLVPSRS